MQTKTNVIILMYNAHTKMCIRSTYQVSNLNKGGHFKALIYK